VSYNETKFRSHLPPNTIDTKRNPPLFRGKLSEERLHILTGICEAVKGLQL